MSGALPPHSWRAVVAAVAQDHGLTYRSLVGPSRSRTVSPVRACAYAVLVARGNSRKCVGEWLGRNHTTVIHGLRQLHVRYVRERPELADTFRRYAPEGATLSSLTRGE